jgi:hypothetical protein
MLPIITVSDLQRNTKAALDAVKDYAVVQSHGDDRAFILHPELGRILLESGMLDALREKLKVQKHSAESGTSIGKELEKLIGPVLRELSKK